eukprot:1882714-Pleurochrysis_carterae.AAC.3
MAESEVCYELANEALQNDLLVFCLDDKLGSHWQFLPIPPGGREGKKTTGRWKYRQCLQGNFFPGVGNFLSVIPPMLHTGSNFGCSIFVFSIFRLIKLGKLDLRAERIVCQTDGGPDNVAWVTHGVHVMLVREAVFDQIDWIRRKPGHSHNQQVCTSYALKLPPALHVVLSNSIACVCEPSLVRSLLPLMNTTEACCLLSHAVQDQTFAIVKCIFIPFAGGGDGCRTPWEMEARLVDKLKTMNGGLEMLWQLASYDFTGWLDDCVSSKFAHCGNERYWRYKLDLMLVDHGYVHVSYKATLTTKATDTEAEFKPLLPAPRPGACCPTDPNGIQFMLQFPSYHCYQPLR